MVGVLCSALGALGCSTTPELNDDGKEMTEKAVEAPKTQEKAQEAPQMQEKVEEAGTMVVHQTWHGLCSGIFDEPGGDVRAREPMLIQNQEDFDNLIGCIPTHRIQKRRGNPPPSDDPLLKRPEIDFTKHSMIAVFRMDIMDGDMIFEKITRDGNNLTAEVTWPPPGERLYAARPITIGGYTAVLIDECNGCKLTVK